MWDPAAETADAASEAETIAAKLPGQLAYVAETSPFYRRLWKQAGVDAAKVRILDDLAALPFTEKDDLRRSQDDHPPLGETQGAPFDEIVRIQCTGGTTGIPMRTGFAPQDIAWLDEVAARCVRCAGGRPGDLVLECMNYSLYVGGVTDHMGFEHAGLCVLPYGVGNSLRLLELVTAMRTPWLLYSTPAYSLRLAQVAREHGMEPRELGLRKCIFSGEGGLQVPGFRDLIEQTWDCVAQDLYGLSETGCMAVECEHRTGLHILTRGHYAVELIEPSSGDVLPMEDGAVGELVYTNLDRRASYLVRYRSHDLVRIHTSPCPCGRTGPRFSHVGRSDDMFIVRGVNVFPLGVQDVLYGMRPALSGEFRIILDQAPPIDYAPRLVVERGDDESADLTERVTRAVQQRLGFTPAVELVPAETLPRAERKSKRLFRVYDGEVPE
ncbi:MAG: phenylacetate-CoA ligase [Gaiellales bacterium]|jgi:phenylacetate-CoA ligase|nr:phenylacetate-CoA ligase [Gaiellales bacterium]